MTVAPVRRRQAGPKAKTGCLTCKIRRVKCDEAKPSCKRCTSTGRSCDGYPTPDTLVSNPSNALIHRLHTHVQGTAREKRGFQYFLTNTAAELTGYYTSSFWEHLILQASAAEPALRHAVIAIGSLHEEFTNKRLDSSPGFEDSGSGFAISQYTKAISHLRRSLSAGKQAPLTALMSCILFVCFDSLRGYFDSAMVHLQSGLKILGDMRTKSQEDDDIVENNLSPLFMRLSMQSILYIETRDTGAKKQIARQLMNVRLTEEPEIPDAFESLEEARSALNRAADGLFRMFYLCDGDEPMHAQPPEAFAMHQKYHTQLLQWESSFASFMSTHSSSLTNIQVRGAALLKIQNMTAKIMAEAVPDLDDDCTIAVSTNAPSKLTPFTPQFQTIVSLSRGLIAASESDAKIGKPALRFSTDLGVVAPLWYTCLKCIDIPTREQALELMSRCPRREGMWDSAMGVRMIRSFWAIQEEHRKMQEENGLAGDEVGIACVPFSVNEAVDLVLQDGMRWEWKWKDLGTEMSTDLGTEMGTGSEGMSSQGHTPSRLDSAVEGVDFSRVGGYDIGYDPLFWNPLVESGMID